MLDTVIVGGGPAGLSAALVLGRACRRVLVCDAGEPRNARSRAAHGLLTRDPIAPAELRRIAREQLAPYDTVALRDATVADAVPTRDGFAVKLADGERLRSRTLLLATGLRDRLPPIDGVEAFYGRSLFHCPYCDGWEVRGQPLAVYGRGGRGLGLALELTQWSRDLVLCTDGPTRLRPDQRERLARNGIALRSEHITRLEGADGTLKHIVFARGEPLPRRAIFFNVGVEQRSELPAKLGCHFTERGAVRPGKLQSTNVPHLYVAGDAAYDVHFIVVAAAEGARAAYAVNTELLRADLA